MWYLLMIIELINKDMLQDFIFYTRYLTGMLSHGMEWDGKNPHIPSHVEPWYDAFG